MSLTGCCRELVRRFRPLAGRKIRCYPENILSKNRIMKLDLSREGKAGLNPASRDIVSGAVHLLPEVFMYQPETAPATARPVFYKRQYIVDKPFQFRLIGTLFSISCANSLFFAVIVYFMYDGHLKVFYDVAPREGATPLLSLPALFGASVLFVTIFGLAVSGIVALYMSNQIAGPLFRTRQLLERVGAGDLRFQLRFRHNDFLTDFGDAFNRMGDELRRSTEEEIQALDAIEDVASDRDAVVAKVRELSARKRATVSETDALVLSFPDGEPVAVAAR